jgi:hypothetical protein
VEENALFIKPLVAAAAAGGVLLSAAPAQAADTGLYGKGDATYDGVYRQSLSILALKATGQKIPKSAITWLKKQQCADGGFMEYRTDLSKPCAKPNATNLTGQELNGTAVAVAALTQTGNRKQAKRAAKWIGTKQNPDNGFAYFPAKGAASDTASTSLAIAAMSLVARSPQQSYLRAVQFRCAAPTAQRGAMQFDTELAEPNDGATAQAALWLGGGMTLPKPTKIAKSAPSLSCSGKSKDKASADDAALGYLNKRLVATKGALPYGFGYEGTDYAGSASAALALANAGAGRKAVRTTVTFLKKNAETWISAAGDDAPGSLALLILVANATGENPRDFGGVNLIKRLARTQR